MKTTSIRFEGGAARRRRLSVAALLIIGLAADLFAPAPAAAYERDVHYLLTYVLCRVKGFDDSRSLMIASADEALDNNDTTVAKPRFFVFQRSWWVERGRRWHALDFSREEVERQRDRLWERSIFKLEEKPDQTWERVPAAEPVYFGQYLHFLQDHYSHRRLDLLNWPAEQGKPYETRGTPYDPLVAHAFDGGQPDRIPRNTPKAKEMARHTALQIDEFKKHYPQGPGGSCLIGGIDEEPDPIRKQKMIDKRIDQLVDALATAYKIRGTGPEYGEAKLEVSRKKLQELLDLWLACGVLTQPIQVPKWECRIKYSFRLDGSTKNVSEVDRQWRARGGSGGAAPQRERARK